MEFLQHFDDGHDARRLVEHLREGGHTADVQDLRSFGGGNLIGLSDGAYAGTDVLVDSAAQARAFLSTRPLPVETPADVVAEAEVAGETCLEHDRPIDAACVRCGKLVCPACSPGDPLCTRCDEAARPAASARRLNRKLTFFFGLAATVVLLAALTTRPREDRPTLVPSRSDPVFDGMGHDFADAFARGLAANEKGQLSEAERQYRVALAVAEQRVARAKSSTVARSELAETLARLGYVLNQLQQDAEAELLLRRSLDLAEQLLAESPGDTGAQLDIGLTAGTLGLMREGQGDLAEAEKLDRRALAMFEARAGLSKDLLTLNQLWDAYQRVGRVARARGDLPAAQAAYRRCRDVAQAIVKRTDAQPAQDRLARSLEALAELEPAR